MAALTREQAWTGGADTGHRPGPAGVFPVRRAGLDRPISVPAV
ncbi:MAG: hypothetical protein R6V15_14730 [Desulfotignum sp.]